MSLAAIGHQPMDAAHQRLHSCRDRLRTEPVLLRAIILATAGFALVEHPLKDGQAEPSAEFGAKPGRLADLLEF
ncbi:hypothetical protein LOS78_14895 [Paracoccus sp. MA]|uniref:hypothetical protein n=1 Tax=Paracoccus sp. MA TaxID=2895796 RepID=UPI001E4F56B5|nr:hypothetical protein [Paracoccus sp. MA]UFM64955.1 hypothetical protein LOS78_14895 [Paracoccus sp. MA]